MSRRPAGPARPAGRSAAPARDAARRTAFLLAAVLAGALLPACGRRERPAAAAPAEPVVVRTARAGGAGDGWIEVPGAIEAALAATLASRHSAAVEEVRVEEGSAVRAGDLLIVLDAADLRARIAAAEAALAAATAHRDRIAGLFARGAATRQELDGAEVAHAAALAERDAARGQLAYAELRAPFDGRVTDKRVRRGDLAVPGQPLLAVQGIARLRVAASVTERQADRMKTGDPVTVILEDGSRTQARISVVGPAGDPASRRFLVKADLAERSGARAGSFARLRLPHAGDAAPAALVPRAALVERGALTGVYVVEDGRARLRWISPGEPAGDALVVRAGLDPGEEVILDPGPLRDGTPVRPVGAEAAAEAPPGDRR
jgi:RND family efflux transporter MFP subunit